MPRTARLKGVYGRIVDMPYWLDGNNLIGQTAARAREDPATRRAFLAALGEFARSRGGRFVVFFDGDDHDRLPAPVGVQVRYSAPRSTDDAILQRLGEVRTPSEIVVVTNDRSLGADCRAAGAKTMDWTTFESTMRLKGRARPSTRDTKEEKVNLDEWARYFGLDKKTLR